jgi:hypothetical protein
LGRVIPLEMWPCPEKEPVESPENLSTEAQPHPQVVPSPCLPCGLLRMRLQLCVWGPWTSTPARAHGVAT